MKQKLMTFHQATNLAFFQLHVSLILIYFLFTLIEERFSELMNTAQKILLFPESSFIFVYWNWLEELTFNQKPCYNCTRNLKIQRRS